MSKAAAKFPHDPALVSKVRELWWTVMFLLTVSVIAAALPVIF